MAKATPPMAARAEAIAAATPEAAIHAVLKQFMPKRPVTIRLASKAPPPIGHPDSAFGEDGELRVGQFKVERQPARFAPRTGAKRRAVSRVQRYEPTGKVDTSRPGTFRRYMLTHVILAHSEVTAARRFHADSGQDADQTINFAWAEKEGYIRFI